MSTPNESPVTDLMADLGISGDATTNDADPTNNENDLSDSDTSTLENKDEAKSDTSVDTDTPDGDTDTKDGDDDLSAKLEAYELEIETMKKRISDKDKFINQLQQGKQEDPQDGNDASDNIDIENLSDDDSFWDDPEGKFKAMMEEMNKVRQEAATANFRVDENIFARTIPDYYDVVTPEAIADYQAENPNFVTELQSQENKFQFAYTTLKGRVDSKTAEINKIKEEAKLEAYKEMGIDPNKPKKKVPPSINNIGSANNDAKTEVSADGFASVFGYEG